MAPPGVATTCVTPGRWGAGALASMGASSAETGGTVAGAAPALTARSAPPIAQPI